MGYDELVQRINRLERRLANILVEGVIAQVQTAPYQVRVNIGTEDEPQLTNWLTPTADRAGTNGQIWWPLEINEAVTIISPNGDIERGRVTRSRFTDVIPPPSTDLNMLQVNIDADNHFSFNRSTGIAKLAAKNTAVLQCNVEITENLTVNKNTTIKKNAAISGTSTAADHLSDGISGKGHKHPGDSGGSTQGPQ
ncbi:Uncharacterised protein [BD1-7 clade bacterium]|uniref:Gp5/Type VI secretion system Vgr protein OB-fold domain-containing protein n=1 Tax=BD1-7 clade bacterium TaxID=2029982 RepID=A0A5S9P2X6_9GAMM|nr:Uncharacterised protein [BD1-7 clade bacterium]CAA0122851.1 Uncharacterised protein [BD1-7 clade bacterium]